MNVWTMTISFLTMKTSENLYNQAKIHFFLKINFQNLPKSVENRFRQVPQVDLDLQNSKRIAKTPQNSQNRLKKSKN